MKKVSYIILSFFLFFSIANVNAEVGRGFMDDLMDFPYGVEEFRLKVHNMDYYYFRNNASQALYDNFRASDVVIKDEIMSLYRLDYYDYYRMNGIVSEYNMFVYHSNKMFLYLNLKESTNDPQLNAIMLKHYTLARQYYDRAKFLMSSDYKKLGSS